jgi:hypothetical protein
LKTGQPAWRKDFSAVGAKKMETSSVSGLASTLLKPKWLCHFGTDWPQRRLFRVFTRALTKKSRGLIGILFFNAAKVQT